MEAREGGAERHGDREGVDNQGNQKARRGRGNQSHCDAYN
jgi:hypothetical protein